MDLNTKHAYELSKDVKGVLLGYSLLRDSIRCYFELKDNIYENRFSINDLNQLIPKVQALNYIQEIKRDTSIKISAEEKIIVQDHSLGLCFAGDFKWRLGNKISAISCNDKAENNKPNWMSVSVKPDKTALLYVQARYGFVINYSKIYKVDIKSGMEKIIVKGANPSYSPCGLFFLYKKNKREEYKILTCDGDSIKRLSDCSFDRAFWVYEKN